MFDRLQKLQNRAARVLTFSRYDAYANRLFRQLNWKDLSTQFLFFSLSGNVIISCYTLGEGTLYDGL